MDIRVPFYKRGTWFSEKVCDLCKVTNIVSRKAKVRINPVPTLSPPSCSSLGCKESSLYLESGDPVPLTGQLLVIGPQATLGLFAYLWGKLLITFKTFLLLFL